MEDEVELAHVLESLVETLDKHLDEVEDAELGLGRVHRNNKEQSRVVSVDEPRVAPADQAAVQCERVCVCV